MYNWDGEPECVDCGCFNVGYLTCQNCINELINNWMIMLNTTEYDNEDAGLVRDEMKKYLKTHNQNKEKLE